MIHLFQIFQSTLRTKISPDVKVVEKLKIVNVEKVHEHQNSRVLFSAIKFVKADRVSPLIKSPRTFWI